MMQISSTYKPGTANIYSQQTRCRPQGSIFARQLDTAMEKGGCRHPDSGDRIRLGTISADQPTVSHLLAEHPDYSRDCWEIVHSRTNSAKAYTRIAAGTEIFMNPKTREITWDSVQRSPYETGLNPPQSLFQHSKDLDIKPGRFESAGHHPDIENAIDAAAARHGLSRELIAGVIRAESNFDVHAVSPAGAQGLMQLMPETARELGVENPFDIRENIDAGTRYLKQMLRLFGNDLEKALSAYNAGPGTVRRFNGSVPYAETRQYVERVISYLS